MVSIIDGIWGGLKGSWGIMANVALIFGNSHLDRFRSQAALTLGSGLPAAETNTCPHPCMKAAASFPYGCFQKVGAPLCGVLITRILRY